MIHNLLLPSSPSAKSDRNSIQTSVPKNTGHSLPQHSIGGIWYLCRRGKSRHQHFSFCLWLPIVEAKFWVSVAKRWDSYLLYSFQLWDRGLTLVWGLDYPHLVSLQSRGHLLWDESQETRDCSFPSSFMEHPDPKAGVSPRQKHATVPTPRSKGVAQRFCQEREVGIKQSTLKLFQKELSLFSTESRNVQA